MPPGHHDRLGAVTPQKLKSLSDTLRRKIFEISHKALPPEKTLNGEIERDHLSGMIRHKVPFRGTDPQISSQGGSMVKTTLTFDSKQPCSGPGFSGNHQP